MSTVPVLAHETTVHIEECELTRIGRVMCACDDNSRLVLPTQWCDEEFDGAHGGRKGRRRGADVLSGREAPPLGAVVIIRNHHVRGTTTCAVDEEEDGPSAL